MREFLEDAHRAQENGYTRVQEQLKPKYAKRFYKKAAAEVANEGVLVTLDGRITKTPGEKKPIALPNQAFAEALVAEWESQGEEIIPETMPMVRLVNSAIEGGPEAIAALRAEIVKYISSDLLLYRAESPRELVERQQEHWDAILNRVAQTHSVSFMPTVGIMFQDQPQITLDRLAARLEGLGHISLCALVSITGLTGSGLIAVALLDALVEPEAAWTAAHIDEDHNARLWGEDPEAIARRNKRRIEFDAALRVLALADRC